MFYTNEDCTSEVTEGEELPMTTMISHVQLSTSPSGKDKNQLQTNKVAVYRITQCPSNLTSVTMSTNRIWEVSNEPYRPGLRKGMGPLGSVHQMWKKKICGLLDIIVSGFMGD